MNQQVPPGDFQDGEIKFKATAEQVIQLEKDIKFLLRGRGDADLVYLLNREEDLEAVYLSNLVILPTSDANLPDSAINPTTGKAHSQETFVLRNTGIGSLTVDQIQVNGTGFGLLNLPPLPFVLPPNGSEMFGIEFNGVANGTFNGGVSVQHSGFDFNPYLFNLIAKIVPDSTPPTVNLVEPSDGVTVIEGTTLHIRADAMDDIGVDRVEFRVDGDVVSTDTTAPFGFDFNPTVDRLRVVTATVFDFGGNTGTSPPVRLDVVPDQPPVISCVPPSGSFFAVGPTTVTCTATDDVRVERVEFLVNDQVIQTVTEEPYIAQFVVPPGVNPFVLQARAIDSGGRIDLVSITLSVFATPIMTKTSIVVGSDGFSTNDSEVLGEPLVQPVRVFDSLNQTERFHFFPYGGSFTGGVRVATGDVNGDRVPDIITGAGAGASGAHVKVFSGVNGAEIRSFFDIGVAGHVWVASSDFNRDGFDDIIVGGGAGTLDGHVKVFSGQTGAELDSFFAFPGFLGGVTVAGADVNGDGRVDIIVGAGPGATGGHVKAFSGQTGAEIRSFFAFAGFMGGVTVAGGDINSDGFGDIIVSAGVGATGGHVKVFDGATSAELHSFFAYPGFPGGVRVATGDFNNDGTPDIITGPGPGAGPQVKIFEGITLAALDSFFAYDAGFTGGVFVSGVASPPVTVVNLPLGGGAFEVFENNGDVVVRRQGGGEVFRGPQADNPRLRINGPPNVNDRLIVNWNLLSAAITFDGGVGGNDALRLDGSFLYAYQKHQFLSGSDGLIVLDPGTDPSFLRPGQLRYSGLEPIEDNLAVVDRVFTFPDTDDNILLNTGDSPADSILRIDSNNSEVVDFQQPTGSLTIESASNDTANIGAGWTFADTAVVDGKFVRILTQTPLTLRMIGPHDWSNPIHPLDVNASNSIEPLDALIIINELNDPQFHNAGGSLVSAPGLAVFPDFFYDANPDGFVVPLDALVIINFINNLVGSEGEANDEFHSALLTNPVDQVFSQLSDRDSLDSIRSSRTGTPRQQFAVLIAPSKTHTVDCEVRETKSRSDSGNSLSQDEYIDALDRLLGEFSSQRTSGET